MFQFRDEKIDESFFRFYEFTARSFEERGGQRGTFAKGLSFLGNSRLRTPSVLEAGMFSARSFILVVALVFGDRSFACSVRVAEAEFFEEIADALHLPTLVRTQMISTADSLVKISPEQFVEFKQTVLPLLKTGAPVSVLRASYDACVRRLPAEAKSLGDFFKKHWESYVEDDAYQGALYWVTSSLAVFAFSSLRENRQFTNRFFEQSINYLSGEANLVEWECEMERLFGQIVHH